MKKEEIFKNIAFVTLPLSLGISTIGFLILKSVPLSIMLGCVFFAASLKSNISKYYHDIQREKAGVTRHAFNARRVFDLVPIGDLGPALCFELDGENFLLVNGHWIFSEDTYGEEAKKYYDEESDFFNGYKKPYSFPAASFEIWTSNLDNRPVKISITGDYLQPEQVAWELPRKFIDTRFAVVKQSEIKP